MARQSNIADAPDAGILVVNLLKNDSQNAFAIIVRGEIYQAKGEFDEAIGDYEFSIRLDPGRAAVGHFNCGVLYSTRGKVDRAIREYDEAIRLDPQYASAYSYRGTGKAALSSVEAGIADHNAAVAVEPNSARYYFHRALTYEEIGRLRKSFADINETSIVHSINHAGRRGFFFWR